MTATPIKTSKEDLHTYVSIARDVLQKENLDASWIEEIGTEGKSADSIICSSFDYSYPVTRYFKDTIRSINVEGYEKNKARRLIPQLWEYDCSDDADKNEVMLKNINRCLSENMQSRFVVFTRFVERQANLIGEFLESKGFKNYSSDISDSDKTYKIVTGNNSYELSQYSGYSKLPTVLILTYQIAEQGVNLPGYNYVINYHISAFPSALEQRFGRIDRMGKKGSLFPEINMCFLISKGRFDANTWNFYCAMSVYLRNLITYLPSKNTILSEEIVKKYISKKSNIDGFVNRIKDLLNSEHQIELVIEYFDEKNNISPDVNHDVECKCDDDLFSFIDENAIEIDMDLLADNSEKAISQFKSEIVGRLKEYEVAFNSGELPDSKIIELIKALGDKIFYRNGEIYTVDAIEDCGKTITNNTDFISYKEAFSKNVKLPLVIQKYKKIINEFFENKFIENDFISIFPYEGYKHIIRDLLSNCEDVCNEDRELLINNAIYVVSALPFFNMCNIYKNIIHDMQYSMRWGRMGYDYNQFQSAFFQLYHVIRNSEIHLGLSESFFNKYFGESEETIEWFDRRYEKHRSSNIYVNSKEHYAIVRNDENVLQATNWYKLAYHYTCKVAGFWDSNNRWFSGKNNPFFVKENLIKYLVVNYQTYIDALKALNELGKDTSSRESQEVYEYEVVQNELTDVIQQIEKIDDARSLFNFYYFSESGAIRKYSFDKPSVECGKVFINDIWTQGIIFELFGGKRYSDCMVGSIYPFPEMLKNIHICY